MTDKEEIIIDGANILKEKINMCFILLLNKLETPETIEQTIYEHLDAFVKEWNAQLARKTQECEELEKNLKNEKKAAKIEIETYNNSCLQLQQENDELYLERNVLNTANSGLNSVLEMKEQELNRYRKALEEIEEVIKSPCAEDCVYYEYSRCYDCIKTSILDIINKAKGGRK